MAYVYGLFYENNKDENICFYIGKGSKYRMREHFKSCRKGQNSYKDNKIKKLKQNGKSPFPKKLAENLTHQKALELEKALLSKEKLFSELTNLTKGGEGLTGYRHSEETKIKMSKNRSGKNHHFHGKNRSEEFKEKLSETMKGRRTGKDHPLWSEEVSEETKKKISKNVSGEQHGNSKLSRDEAKEVKKMAQKGEKSQKQIAAEFNISSSQVSAIKRGRKWSCLE